MTVCVSVSTGVQQHFIFTMIIFIIVLDAVNSIVVLDISKISLCFVIQFILASQKVSIDERSFSKATHVKISMP